MSGFGRRLLMGAARSYLKRRDGSRFDLSAVRLLSKRTRLPLRRDGLDPVPELAAVRSRARVSRLPAPFGLRVWLVTGYAEAKAVLADAAAFSTDFAHLAGDAFGVVRGPGGLGFADPPEHTRLRSLLTPEFTMRRLARLVPRIHAIVEERLDFLAEQPGPVDLVEAFALPIPSLVICELLGVPYEDRERFQRLAMHRFDIGGGAKGTLDAIDESLTYLRKVVERQRRYPGDGLLGQIITEHGDEVDDEELAGLADGVLTGGFETTASMLALGTLVLLRDPEAFERLRTRDDAVSPFVEEVLRLLSVVQVAFPRFARHDLTVAGTTVAAGDMVVVSLSGANRDPLLDGSHLAFGHGIHRCVGAELARMELRAAYPALVRRFPDARLAVPASRLAFRRMSIVYGVQRLPVHLRPST